MKIPSLCLCLWRSPCFFIQKNKSWKFLRSQLLIRRILRGWSWKKSMKSLVTMPCSGQHSPAPWESELDSPSRSMWRLSERQNRSQDCGRDFWSRTPHYHDWSKSSSGQGSRHHCEHSLPGPRASQRIVAEVDHGPFHSHGRGVCSVPAGSPPSWERATTEHGPAGPRSSRNWIVADQAGQSLVDAVSHGNELPWSIQQALFLHGIRSPWTLVQLGPLPQRARFLRTRVTTQLPLPPLWTGLLRVRATVQQGLLSHGGGCPGPSSWPQLFWEVDYRGPGCWPPDGDWSHGRLRWPPAIGTEATAGLRSPVASSSSGNLQWTIQLAPGPQRSGLPRTSLLTSSWGGTT